TLRERALLVLSAVAVIWLAWDWSVGQSQRAALEQATREVSQLAQRITAETNAHVALRRAQLDDPNGALVRERASLEQEIAALDSRLEATVGRFVPPTQVPKLLESVVARHQGVELVRVKSLAAEPVRVREDMAPALFRHPLQVELEGGYFEVQSYLADLESSNWKFAWRTLDYQVAEYPRAKVLIEIETLSPDRNWLGV
ncbi:MAG: hypothetical protein HC809_09430, partial [Gammaproteobacteria bacterium]|nr:hypothetical protein [Gammaproteobacteria bacterium]